jgi:hypothetical protein
MIDTRGDFQRKSSAMCKSQQYDAKANEYGELTKASVSRDEGRILQKRERHVALFAEAISRWENEGGAAHG